MSYKKTSSTPIPGRKEQKRLTKEMLNKQKLAEIITADESPKKCPNGTIRRPAYVRSSKKTAVPAACIKDQGRPGVGLYDKNGERVFVHLPKEILGQYGYKNIIKLSAENRKQILDKAYLGFNKNWLSLFRTLNYLAVLNKGQVELHKRLIQDRDYIRSRYGPKLRST